MSFCTIELKTILSTCRTRLPSLSRLCAERRTLMRFTKFGMLLLTSCVLAAPVFELAEVPQPEPYTFLRTQLKFSRAELLTLEDGKIIVRPVSYTHLRAHETPEQLVC